MSGIQSLTVLIGRILLSAIFVMSGADKIMHWSQTVEQMKGEGMIWVPFFLVVSIVLELGGGLLVLLGWYARAGAVALILFLIPVTAIFHDFWQYEGQQQQMQMIHFSKNVAILGGLLLLLACGAGRYSIGNRRARHP